MKKIILITSSIMFALMLVSCNGYNNILYDHLSDNENYIEVTGILQEIYYYNGNDKIIWDESTDLSLNNHVTSSQSY